MKLYLILAFALLLQIVALGQNVETIIPNRVDDSSSDNEKAKLRFEYSNASLYLNDDNRYWIKIKSENDNYSDLIVKSDDNRIFIPDSVGNIIFSRIDSADFNISFSVYRVNSGDSMKLCSQRYYFLPFPHPTAELSSITHNEFNRKTFPKSAVEKPRLMLLAPVLNYNWDLQLNVTSFSIIVLREQRIVYKSDIVGYLLPEKERKTLNRKLKRGDEIVFYNIMYKNRTTQCPYLNTITKIVETYED